MTGKKNISNGNKEDNLVSISTPLGPVKVDKEVAGLSLIDWAKDMLVDDKKHK